jgi:hypothetical protein
MGWGLSVNAYSFGMSVFKYYMNLLRTRLNAEWQDLHIQYPEWLTRVVMSELYYITALVLVCTACFAVGLAVGFIVVIL